MEWLSEIPARCYDSGPAAGDANVVVEGDEA